MTEDKYVLAVDHGTSGVKTALMSITGRLVDFENEKVETFFIPPGGAEQDPEQWWNGLVKTCRRLVDKALVPAGDIVAICCSSTFSSTVAVNKDGNHLDNSLIWMDSRGAPHVKRLVKGFPSVEGYGLFKVMEWIRKTGGGPQLSGKDDIAHVLYWKHDKPEVYENTFKFLSSKDYLNLRLTGEIKASFDSMPLFWATDIRDVKNMRYDLRLVSRMGLDIEKLPHMQQSTDVLGELLPEVAAAMGLPPGVKVVTGSPDHQSACIGSGAVRDFEAHVYIGTSSWIQCIVPFKKTDMFHSIASLPTSIPGKYYSANEQDIAGGALSFLLDRILFPDNELRPGRPPEGAYEKLDRVAGSSPPGSNKVLFTPWLNGERTPVDDTTVRGGLHNLSVSTSNADIVRSVLEGVALNGRWALKYIERFVGRKLDPLNMVGGGAVSDLWCRIYADVTGRTVRKLKHPMQANARGAAFIAAVGLGYMSFDRIPGLVEYEKTFEPDTRNRRLYNELFREFVHIYKTNKAMYKRLNRLS